MSSGRELGLTWVEICSLISYRPETENSMIDGKLGNTHSSANIPVNKHIAYSQSQSQARILNLASLIKSWFLCLEESILLH